ncbi:unnamed protein product [Arabis nemorensis]|uniref:Fungal lipase-type domain-containing protein n=1 Tax=Arabis nemorensis TaxID=586526 RepID=A0A565BTY5_9BRAS|nr:unnamed protein product [Arabis nemorensis]
MWLLRQGKHESERYKGMRVETASKSGKQIVFTGHSSGGATAILATVWYLQNHFITNPNGLPEPRCVTFGAPLLGDYVFKHALGREKWSRFFTNFVTRFDIVPRIMLAQKASVQTLPRVLSQLSRTRDSIQENDPVIANENDFGSLVYATLMVLERRIVHLALSNQD